MSDIRPRVTRRGGLLDWIKFDFELARDGSVDPTDKALYAAIASFVDIETRESPGSNDVDLNAIPGDVPTRQRLAKCIGRSLDTVDRSTKRLEAKGLLKVHRQADPDHPKLNLPSEYELLDHELWDERAAARAARRAARRQDGRNDSPGDGGGRTDAATPDRVHAATPGRTDAAVKDIREVEEEKEGEKAALPRSGGDGRRPSGRSKGSREGGCAASGKDSPAPSKKQPKHSQQELDLVAAVRRYFPQELAVPDIPAVSDAVLKALATGQPDSRTVEQLGARIESRWYTHKWASKLLAGEKIASPAGVAIDLVQAYGRDDKWGCANPRCEAGKDADTEAPCPTCPERLDARKAARGHDRPQEAADSPTRPAVHGQVTSTVPEQCPAVTRVQNCPECDRGFRAPEPGLCRDCREDAAIRAQQPTNAPF